MRSRLLGWSSLVLGATVIAVPATLPRRLDLPGGPWLVRAFGVRDVAGLEVLGKPEHAFGTLSWGTGAVFDINLPPKMES